MCSEARLKNAKGDLYMEFLKELLSEETYQKLEEELQDKDVKLANLKTGDYVSVEKYNNTLKDLDSTREELEQRTKDLTSLKENANASEELKAQIEKLEQDFEQKEQEYQQRLEQNKKDAIFERELIRSGAIDTLAVKAHLREFLEEAEVKEDEILGLGDKI